MTDVRLEGLALRVADVKRSIVSIGTNLVLCWRSTKHPHFAMIRVGGPTRGTIGLLPHEDANPLGSASGTSEQRAGIQIELTTDNLDALYENLKARGVVFLEPPHEEPWKRSMRTKGPC